LKLNNNPLVGEVTVIVAFGLVQVGCTTETTGEAGIPVTASITIFTVAAELHPAAFVTVKLKVPAVRLPIVLLLPVPVTLPGFITQLPAGNPFKITEPEGEVQVGCVIVPTIGTAGVVGCVFINTDDVGMEEHPVALVTIKLYVPLVRLAIIVLLPDPEILPGLIVQLPVGKPLNTTEPVATVQLGCVIVPKAGVVTAGGCVIVKVLDNAVQLTLFSCLAKTV
jgi:hypothetical protein